MSIKVSQWVAKYGGDTQWKESKRRALKEGRKMMDDG